MLSKLANQIPSNIVAVVTVLLIAFPPCKQKAVEVMCFVPKRCNDMMNVGRLQGFEVYLWMFGSSFLQKFALE